MSLDKHPTSADLAGHTVDVLIIWCHVAHLGREVTARVISDRSMGSILFDGAVD
jgi:hypothetical protein